MNAAGSRFTAPAPSSVPDQPAIPGIRPAILLWGIWFLVALAINATVPFALGVDVRAWTGSLLKGMLFGAVVYGALFLGGPLVCTKGWRIVRTPGFALPLLLAIVALGARPFLHQLALVPILVLAYLHWRYDLSELGFRSRGRGGDLAAVLLLGLVVGLSGLMQLRNLGFLDVHWEAALAAFVDRLLFNPASTVETLFYFGFLTPRLAVVLGRRWTPLAVGAMYVAHEMTNPEYWYQGMPFALVFGGIVIFAAVALWRRSILPIWLGDALGRGLSYL